MYTREQLDHKTAEWRRNYNNGKWLARAIGAAIIFVLLYAHH